METYKNNNNKYNDLHLKELINKVMIRNRRKDTNIEWTKRKVETILIELTKEERELYDHLSSFRGNNGIFDSAFTLLTLQREACSSREAVFQTLKNFSKKNEPPSPLLEKFIQTTMQKIDNIKKIPKRKGIDLIRKINKVIIFTEYRATIIFAMVSKTTDYFRSF